MDLHSTRNAHFHAFFTYVKRKRFSVRKRTKTNAQISHVLYAHSIRNFRTFLANIRIQQNNKIACAIVSAHHDMLLCVIAAVLEDEGYINVLLDGYRK